MSLLQERAGDGYALRAELRLRHQPPATAVGRAALLQERPGDGYVLRVDLRLRPDPSATAVALAIPSAYAYYETLGQNWERAAMIKARPVAGDKEIGAHFL